LVVAGGVDGEFAEEFAVVGDDADVVVGDAEQDAGAGVGAADADMDELASATACRRVQVTPRQGEAAGFPTERDELRDVPIPRRSREHPAYGVCRPLPHDAGQWA
jgi:hypothetical protein